MGYCEHKIPTSMDTSGHHEDGKLVCRYDFFARQESWSGAAWGRRALRGVAARAWAAGDGVLGPHSVLLGSQNPPGSHMIIL